MLGANDGEEEHKRVWESRSQAEQSAASQESRVGTLLPAHGIHFIPGTGWLSPGFINLGSTRFLGILVEIKRARRPGQENVGYSRSDALAGLEPRPGSVHMLENDRVRVYETTLEPGQSEQSRAQLDSGVYVIDGGRIRVIEEDEQGQRRDLRTGASKRQRLLSARRCPPPVRQHRLDPVSASERRDQITQFAAAPFSDVPRWSPRAAPSLSCPHFLLERFKSAAL